MLGVKYSSEQYPIQAIYRKSYLLEKEWHKGGKGYNDHHFPISGDEFVFIWMIWAVAFRRKKSPCCLLCASLSQTRLLLSIHPFVHQLRVCTVDIFPHSSNSIYLWILEILVSCTTFVFRLSQDTVFMLDETYAHAQTHLHCTLAYIFPGITFGYASIYLFVCMFTYSRGSYIAFTVSMN